MPDGLALKAERRAMEAKREFENVSKLTKTEVARFEQERIEDMKDSLNLFLEGMITRQRQVCIVLSRLGLLRTHLQLINNWEVYQQMLLKKVGNGRAAAAANVS